MEQVSLIPFSKVVATLLLNKRMVTAIDIVNYTSELANMNDGIEVIIDEDDISYLDCCINVDDNLNFSIKEDMDYNTILYDSITVRDFLLSNSINYSEDIFIDRKNTSYRKSFIDMLEMAKSNVLYKKKVRGPWRYKRA